jgi:hypothetical protein
MPTQVSAVVTLPPPEGHPAEIFPAVLNVVDGLHVLGDDAPGITVELDAELAMPGRYQVRETEPPRIVINPSCVRPRLVLLHELGHYLDHAAFGDGIAWGCSGQSFDEWRAALEASEAVERLRALEASPELAELTQGYGYFLLEEELWARSYSQWVAVRTNEETLLNELGTSLTALAYPEYWGFEDFAPIADEIDKIFIEATWKL